MAESLYRQFQAADKAALQRCLDRRSIPEPNSGCCLWLGDLLDTGYGKMNWKGKPHRAHRLAWEATHGPIPPGMHVLHKCDVRCCVNVEHLFLGTNADNVADRDAKERAARGMRHPNSKLTPEQALAIRADPRRQVDIAATYGVTQSLISLIQNRKKWAHV